MSARNEQRRGNDNGGRLDGVSNPLSMILSCLRQGSTGSIHEVTKPMYFIIDDVSSEQMRNERLPNVEESYGEDSLHDRQRRKTTGLSRLSMFLSRARRSFVGRAKMNVQSNVTARRVGSTGTAATADETEMQERSWCYSAQASARFCSCLFLLKGPRTENPINGPLNDVGGRHMDEAEVATDSCDTIDAISNDLENNTMLGVVFPHPVATVKLISMTNEDQVQSNIESEQLVLLPRRFVADEHAWLCRCCSRRTSCHKAGCR